MQRCINVPLTVIDSIVVEVHFICFSLSRSADELAGCNLICCIYKKHMIGLVVNNNILLVHIQRFVEDRVKTNDLGIGGDFAEAIDPLTIHGSAVVVIHRPAFVLEAVGFSSVGGEAFRCVGLGHVSRQIAGLIAYCDADGFVSGPIDNAVGIHLRLHFHKVIIHQGTILTGRILGIQISVSTIYGTTVLGEEEDLCVGQLAQLGVGIETMVRNHHNIGFQSTVGVDIEQNVLCQIHISIQQSIGVLVHVDTKYRGGVVEVALAIVFVAEFPVCAAQIVSGNGLTVFDGGVVGDQLAVCIRQVTILQCVDHIEVDACDIEGLAGVGLVVLHIGVVAGDARHQLVDITGGVSTLDVDVVHNVLQVQLIVMLGEEPGHTQVMIRMGMGEEPGVDDHLLSIGLAGQFAAKLQESVTGLVTPLLQIAAVVDEQTVVGHPDNDQRTAVTLVGGVCGCGGIVVAVFGHGQTVLDDHRLDALAGGLVREACYRILLGIHNDTGLLIEGQVIGVDLVAAVRSFISGKTVGVVLAVGRDLVFLYQLIAGICQNFAVSDKLTGRGSGDDGQIGLFALTGHTVAAVIFHSLRYAAAGGGVLRNGNFLRDNNTGNCLSFGFCSSCNYRYHRIITMQRSIVMIRWVVGVWYFFIEVPPSNHFSALDFHKIQLLLYSFIVKNQHIE